MTKPRLRPATTLFSEAWRLVLARPDPLLTIPLTSLLPLSVTGWFFERIGRQTGPIAEPMTLVALLTALVGVVLISWSLLAFLYSLKEGVGWQSAFRLARGRLLAYFWLGTLELVLITVGFLLFILPGLVLTGYFFLAPYVLVFENVGGLQALKRSWQLVVGNWWGVLGRTLFAGLVMILLAWPGMILARLGGPLGLVGDLYSFAMSILGFSVNLAVGYGIYQDLRTRTPEQQAAPLAYQANKP